MIGEPEFDRLLTAWLEAEGPQDVPTHVVNGALATARRQSQLGGWLDGLLGRRWPADPTGLWSPGGRRIVVLVLIGLAAVALAGAGLLAGGAVLDRLLSVVPTSESSAPTATAAPTDAPAPTEALVRSGPPRFIATGTMPGAPDYPILLKLRDGRVLVMGGFGGVGPVAFYDPATGAFSSAPEPAMSLPSGGSSVTLLDDGRVLIAGGNDPTKTIADGPSFRRGVRGAWLYDPSTGETAATGPMQVARAGHAAVRLLDGRVLVTDWGGSSELYDPRTGTWSVALASTSGSSDSMVALTDGRVLQVRSDGASVFDPVSLAWMAVGAPLTARNQFWTLTALPDGGALLAGGTDNLGAGLTAAERFDPSTGTFHATGSMAFARFQPTAVVLGDGRVLILGASAEGVTTAELYDSRTETFAPIVDPGAPWIGSGVLLDDGRVLITKMGEREALIFDPGAPSFEMPSSTGTFESLGGASEVRIDPSMTMLRDGSVLIAGGRDDGGAPQTSAKRFDPATGAFTPVGQMASARVGHTATLTEADKVLVAGGTGGDGDALASAELFDPARNTFTPARPMPAPRVGATAIAYSQGWAYIAGGSAGDPAEETDTVTVYWGDGTFAPAFSLNAPRSGMTITELMDLRLIVAGGSEDGRAVATAQVYQREPDDVSLVASMGTERVEHAAAVLADGRVLITGGHDAAGATLASAEVFDPQSGQFTAAASMTTPRRDHAMALMLDGTVLVTGGLNADGRPLASTEIFDPRTGTFTPGPTMTTARSAHGAWRLADGRVLLLGGGRIESAEGWVPGPMSAEVYDPSPEQ